MTFVRHADPTLSFTPDQIVESTTAEVAQDVDDFRRHEDDMKRHQGKSQRGPVIIADQEKNEQHCNHDNASKRHAAEDDRHEEAGRLVECVLQRQDPKRDVAHADDAGYDDRSRDLGTDPRVKRPGHQQGNQYRQNQDRLKELESHSIVRVPLLAAPVRRRRGADQLDHSPGRSKDQPYQHEPGRGPQTTIGIVSNAPERDHAQGKLRPHCYVGTQLGIR